MTRRSDQHERNVKYGRQHRNARARAMARFVDGQPCVRCGAPLHTHDAMDLDHDDDGGYRGLAHHRCNRSAGGRIGAAVTAARYFGKTTTSTLCQRCHNAACRRPDGHVSRCW